MSTDINIAISEDIIINLEVTLTPLEGREITNEQCIPNGTATDFTLANNFYSGSTRVFLNGLRQSLNNDYHEISNTDIAFVSPPLSTDMIIVDYRKTG